MTKQERQFREGYSAFLDGIWIDDEALATEYHRFGWNWAKGLADAQLSEHGALDAMPLVSFDEMLQQAEAWV